MQPFEDILLLIVYGHVSSNPLPITLSRGIQGNGVDRPAICSTILPLIVHGPLPAVPPPRSAMTSLFSPSSLSPPLSVAPSLSLSLPQSLSTPLPTPLLSPSPFTSPLSPTRLSFSLSSLLSSSVSLSLSLLLRLRLLHPALLITRASASRRRGRENAYPSGGI
eukprot:768041-Hanusia_phi.AAC.3